MVAGKHAVALLAHGRAARLVGGCIVGVRAYLPPRQKGRGFGAKVIQPGSAKLLQKFQFVFQCLFQHRPGIPAGGRAQAEILVLQHGVQQDFGPVGALGKQGAFKGGHRAGQPGSICRQSRAQRGQRFALQQAAKHDQPVHTGGPIFTLHKHFIILSQRDLHTQYKRRRKKLQDFHKKT